MIKVETKTVVTVDWFELAVAVARQIAKDLKKTMAEASKQPIGIDDLGMLSMYAGDADDGFAVCEILAKGDWEAVRERLWKMDTAARDVVYGYIEECGGPEFAEHFLN